MAKILPLDLEEDWRIRADDCIVWGASLVGANAAHIAFCGILYRIHGANNHCGKTFDNAYLFRRQVAINRLFGVLVRKNEVFFDSASIYLEFLSNKSKAKYLKIAALAEIPLFRKILLVLKILRG